MGGGRCSFKGCFFRVGRIKCQNTNENHYKLWKNWPIDSEYLQVLSRRRYVKIPRGIRKHFPSNCVEYLLYSCWQPPKWYSAADRSRKRKFEAGCEGNAFGRKMHSMATCNGISQCSFREGALGKYSIKCGWPYNVIGRGLSDKSFLFNGNHLIL